MEGKYYPGKGKMVMIWLRIGYDFFKKAQAG
jgi:hypothetical protein